MNKLQKRILMNFTGVIVVTIVAVLGMVEAKNWVNRSEAMRGMENLGRVVAEYKRKDGSVPPESYIDRVKESLEGQVRLGNLYYRARWIEVDSPSDEILAYATRNYHSLFFRPGAIVLLLDGRVKWMDKPAFDKLLAGQQSQMEIDMTPH